MLVGRIQEFINTHLSIENSLQKSELSLLAELKKRFAMRAPSDFLNFADITWLQNCTSRYLQNLNLEPEEETNQAWFTLTNALCSEADLFVAVEKGDLPTIRKLIAAGNDSKAINREGQGLLHVVNRLDVADYLIEIGVELNRSDARGNSPLHLAVKRNNLALVEHFLT